MADISKIKVGDVEYEVKDKTAREGAKIELVSSDGESGLCTYRITFTDGAYFDFDVQNNRLVTGGDTDDGSGDNTGDSDVVGTVDSGNNIVLTGELAVGTYTLKYEHEDGTTTDIGTLTIEDAEEEEPVTPTTYTVTNKLTNCTGNNTAASVAVGAGYVAVISANSGYTLGGVTVTMGGADMTASVVTGGTINISEVTGDLVITATATVTETEEPDEPTVYTVTYNLGGGVTSSNTELPTTVKAGSTYYESFGTADYSAFDIVVTMGGVDVTKTAYSELIVGAGNVFIQNVTGDIVITTTAAGEETPTTYTVTNSLTNCANSNAATSVTEGDGYEGTITANDGYELGTVTVSMGGTDITASAVSGGAIKISSVTGNVVITATANEIVETPNTYKVTYHLTNCRSSEGYVDGDTATVEAGSAFGDQLQAFGGYAISRVTVTMGGTDITDTAVSGNVITITSITGDVVITVTATALYTNLFVLDDTLLNKRWSNSGVGFTGTENGCVVSDYIPVTLSQDADNPTVLRVRGATFDGQACLVYYSSTKSLLTGSNAADNGYGTSPDKATITTDDNGDTCINAGWVTGSFDSAFASAGYVRIGLTYKSGTALTADDVEAIQNAIIVTIDEPIVD